MWWAGVFNAVAFVALIQALKLAPLVHVNAVNSSQTALAAVAGILIFGEPLTLTLALGVALTTAGLLLLDHGQKDVRKAFEPSNILRGGRGRISSRFVAGARTTPHGRRAARSSVDRCL